MKSLWAKGSAAFHRSEYKAALAAYEQGLALARQGKNKLYTGRFLTCIGNVRSSLGQYPEALRNYQQALAIDREIGDRRGEGNALGNIGIVCSSLGQYPQALEHYQQALAIHRETADRRGEGADLGNIGLVYQSLGQYPQALERYQQALAIHRKIGDRRGEGNNLGNIGLVYQSLGQYPQALERYQQALAIHRKIGDRQDEGSALTNIGIVYKSLGQYPQALEHYQQALAIDREIGDRRGEGADLGNIGNVHYALGQYPQALERHQQALAIAREIGDRQGEGGELWNIGIVHATLGEYSQARELLKQALNVFRQIGASAREGAVLVCIGDIELAAGDVRAARSAYELALPLLDQTGEPDWLWRCKDGLAEVQARTGNPTAAIFFGKQAVNTLQSLRRNISSLDTSLQKSFLGDKEGVYRRLADLLIEQGRLDEGQQVLGLLKQEEYFDFVRRDASGKDVALTPVTLTPDERAAQQRYDKDSQGLAALGKEAAQLEKKGDARTEAENERLKNIRASLDEAHKRFRKTLAEIAEAFKRQGEARNAELTAKQLDTDLRGMVRDLGPAVTLVHYLVLPDSLRILVTTPKVILPRKVEIKEADLNRLVHEFRQALQNPASNPGPAAQKLYALLIAPIEQDLAAAGTKTLMVSLDGTLRYIPLEALRDDSSYVAERYAVAVFTEAARDKIKDKPKDDWKLAGFGVSKAHKGFTPLAAVPAELRGIVRDATGGGVLPGVARLDEAFTLQSFRDALGGSYPALHLASHFKFEPVDNLSSFLLLGDGTYLTLAALRDGDFDLGGVDLLTLSACDTAMGGNGAGGREVEGFGALVQKKGAKGVLATLWPVADASTAQLMRELYRLRQEDHLSKAEALRRAQLEMIQGGGTSRRGDADRGQAVAVAASAPASTPQAAFPGYSHPYYWAPFILMGNWR
ncbi:hypothetical protein JCM15519_16050 [Fundidesulfovibrio butyratiphilus]